MDSLLKLPNHFIPLVSLLVLFHLTLSIQQDDKQGKLPPYFHPNHEFIAGRTMEYLPDPIFYDTYIPIIYRIPIPRHTENALRLLWGNVHKCKSNHTTKRNLCPIAYHLFKVTKKLGDDMGFWKPYYINHTAANGQSVKKRTGFEIICNEISQHFFRSYTSRSQLQSYVTALRACSRIGYRVKFRESEENWVVDKAVYYKMLESFKGAYFSDLPSSGSVDWAITLSAYTSVHGLLLTNHVMESVRLATAHRICQSALIPETFVSMEMLKGALQEVERNLTKYNYQLVYSNLEQYIEEYYKLPLADCTFSDDYSFIVRILVPIRRNQTSHRLVEINTIPFLENLPETSGIPTRLCRLKLVAPKFTLIETNTGLLLDTKCEPNQLCKTSEVSTVFESDACTLSLLQDDRQLITNTCKFSCFPVSSLALPLIKRVSSDTYIVVGSSDTKISLNCFRNPEEMISIALKNVGAMKIKLACDCQILYSDHVSYRPRDPCTDNTTVQHILPYHWHPKETETTMKLLHDDPDQTTLKSENQKPEVERLIHTPEQNKSESAFKESEADSTNPVPSPEPKSNNNADIADLDNKNYSPEPKTNIPEPYGNMNIGLGNSSNKDTTPQFSGDLDEAKLEKSVEERERQLENKFRKNKSTNIVMQKLQEIPNGLIVQLIVLWVLIFILLFVVLVLGYHLHTLLKWREMQSYKETRMLYRPHEGKVNRL